MRVKTSVTLPEDLLKKIDREDSNRSAFVERASLQYLSRIERERRDARELDIINRSADRLNAEARAFHEFQDWP